MLIFTSWSDPVKLRAEWRRGLGGTPGGHGGLRQRGAGLHQGEGGEQQPQAGPAAGLHQLQPVHCTLAG